MLPLPLSATILLLCLSAHVSAAPQISTGQVPGQTMVLRKRAPPKTKDDWGVWAKSSRENLQAKYGHAPHQKRSAGTNL